MNTYIITFGSSHLKEISLLVNPLEVMLVIDAHTENEARSIVFESFIGDKFCTSYPISAQERLTSKHGMHPYRIEDLLRMKAHSYQGGE